MKGWTENYTFAAAGLLAAFGALLAVGTAEPNEPGGRVRIAVAQAIDPNATEGDIRGVPTGASQAGPDAAAGKPGDHISALQRTSPLRHGPPGQRQVGGSECPAALEETRPGSGYLAVHP
jgi:hypothetical protein